MTSSIKRDDSAGAARGGATERVVDTLRQAIVTLELAPGAVLDKHTLTARFGVSRFPISEALQRLKGEGLVDVRPQAGSSVSLIRLADVTDNFFIRRALEAEVAETLARRPDPALMDDLERNMRYQKAAIEADDREGFHALDLAFHDRMVSALGHPRLRATVESVRLGLDRVRRLIASPRRHAVTYAEHEVILAGLAAGDPAAARAAMTAHIDAVIEELEEFSHDRPEVFADAAPPHEA